MEKKSILQKQALSIPAGNGERIMVGLNKFTTAAEERD